VFYILLNVLFIRLLFDLIIYEIKLLDIFIK